jgi:hypothetical protein
LPFRVDGIEGKAGLAGAADAGNDDEGVPRKLKGDVLEIVNTGATNDQTVEHCLYGMCDGDREGEN